MINTSIILYNSNLIETEDIQKIYTQKKWT